MALSVEGPARDGDGKVEGVNTDPRVERRGVKDIEADEMDPVGLQKH